MKKTVLAILTAAFTSGAQALDENWYTRVGFGISSADTDVFEEYLADEIAADRGIDQDVSFDHPRGYNLNLGYRLNRYMAFELGYSDFGEEDSSYSYVSSRGDLDVFGYEEVQTDTYKGKVTGTAKTLGAVFSTNTNRDLSGGVRVGYALWSTGAYVTVYSEVDGVKLNTEGEEEHYSASYRDMRVKDDTDGSDPYYGGFVNWRIGKWTYSLEHTLFNTDDADLSVSSISLSMDF